MKLLIALSICLYLSFLFAVACHSIFDIYWSFVYQFNRDISRATYELIHAWEMLGHPQHLWSSYCNNLFLNGVLNFGLMSISSMLIGICLFFAKKKKSTRVFTRYLIYSQLIKDICDSHAYLKKCGSLTIVTLLVIAISSIWVTTWDVAVRDLSYFVDGLGFYEVGERIYSLTNDVRGATLASTCGSNGHDSDQNELKNSRLNRTVVAIYGQNSLQMANRYSALATHYFENFDDYFTDEMYLQKACSIYRKLDRRFDCAKILSFLAYNQVKSGHTLEAHQSVNESLHLLKTDGSTAAEKFLVLFELNSVASLLGDKSEMVLIAESINQLKVTEQKFNVGMYWAVLFVIVSLGITIVVKRWLISLLTNSWHAELLSTYEIELKARVLAKLINLEMLRKDMKAADFYSKELLAISETSSSR